MEWVNKELRGYLRFTATKRQYMCTLYKVFEQSLNNFNLTTGYAPPKLETGQNFHDYINKPSNWNI